MPFFALARLFFTGTNNVRASLLLLLHLAWSKRLFDRAFMTLLCVFLGASRALRSPEPPEHCYLHEVMNSVWRTLSLRDPSAFVRSLGGVVDYLYRRNAVAFSGLTWFWEGADTSSCESYLARVVAQGYVVFDPAHNVWRKEHVYTRYTLAL